MAVLMVLTNYSVGNLTGQNETMEDGMGNITIRQGMLLQPYSMPHMVATSIILGTMILATIIGNVFVIAAILLEKNLQSVANYLILSLAVADLMVAALVMPLAAVNEVSMQWFLGPEVCDVFVSFDVLCCTSSILHLVAIALDRYWAVTQVEYVRNRPARRILLMIALSWVISGSISIPPLFGWRDDANRPEITGECIISQDWGYTVFSTVGAFYLPLFLMLIIYLKVYQAARKSIRKKKFKKTPEQPKPLLLTPEPSGERCDADNGTPMVTLSSRQRCSPDHSSNGSAFPLNDANRNNKRTLSPPSTPLLKDQKSGSFLDITKVYLDFRKTNSPKKVKLERDRQRERIEAKRERKAARTLGIITGSFICCWLPFFIVASVRPFCADRCHFPFIFVSIIGWLGYFNSLLNPIIYTIFNPDFRMAFRKILFGKYRAGQGRR